MKRALLVILWRVLALICVGLAVIGAVLPVLPTVPFLIVAAWAGGKGWPRLERWILDHPTLGPVVRRWRDHGVVPRRAKWLASIMMLMSGLVLAFSPVALWLKLGVPVLMAAVAIWLWRRPEA